MRNGSTTVIVSVTCANVSDATNPATTASI
jgi:hypothetical protein